MSKVKKQFDKAVAYLKRNGLQKTCVRVVRKISLMQEVDYEKWLEAHSPSEEMLSRQTKDNTGEKPVVAVRILAEEENLREYTRATVHMQTYGSLAVSQKECEADYYLLIRNGAALAPHAVYEFVKMAQQYPETELFYSDDDIRCQGKRKEPFMKPEFDEVLFWQWNYLGDVLFIDRNLALRCPDLGDFDDIIKTARSIRRVPQILSHTDGRYRKKRKLVDRMNGETPLISVIIPNKDHREDLKNCVESLIEKGGYQNLEILIVENHSEETETFQYYEELTEKYPSVKILTWKEEFNYSLINNYAAAQSAGTYLLFLNNDTMVKKEGALAELLKWGSCEKCGAIGAQLLYADDTIQHGGVVIGYGGIAGHAFEGMTQEAYEDTVYANVVRQMTAVTAACMLVKKQAFLECGGFEKELKVAYNDIDFCMKLQEHNWQVLYNPFAQFYHFESQTRGLEMTSDKARRVQNEADLFCERWQKQIEQGDRFYNPNLTLEKADFSLDRK